MATSRGYGFNDVLQPSPQKANFMRLMNLVIGAGTKALRLLFDSFFPPIDLANKLQDPAVLETLQYLMDENILTIPQWEKLFPPNNPLDVTSELFDLSLLVKLLRNICDDLTVPANGWDRLPRNTDTSLEAAVATIKYYRNKYSHVDRMEVDNGSFNCQWNRIKGAILRIMKHVDQYSVAECKKYIDESRTAPLSPVDIDSIKDSLGYSEIVLTCNVEGELSDFTVPLNNARVQMQELMDYLGRIGAVLVYIRPGSIKLVLWVKELGSLENLWKRYETGELRKELARILITEELKFLADGEDVELEVSISEEEYKKAQEQLKAKEEEVLAQELEAKMTIGEKPSHFEIFDGDIIEEKENKFQAHFAAITSENQVEQVLKKVKETPDVPGATHYIWAYRIFDAHKDDFDEGCNDDKDDDSGAKVLHLLQGTCAQNLIVIVACLCKTSPLDLGPNRLIYIYKGVLELLLIHKVIRLNSKVKTFLKETEYTSFYKGAATTEDPSVIPTFDIKSGVPIEDRNSKFQGHIADVTSLEQVPQVLHQLKQNKEIANATYNMWACRIYDEKKKSYFGDSDDDGEDRGGERLVYLLKKSDASNVIVIVTHWHGDIPIGNDRCKHIIDDCASDLLQQRKPAAKLSTTSADPKEKKKRIRTSKKHK